MENGVKKKEVDSVTTLGLVGPAIDETPTLGVRLAREVRWLLQEAGTEIAEVGLFVCSAYYGIAVLMSPSVLDKLVTLSKIRTYMDPTILATGALLPSALSALALFLHLVDREVWSQKCRGIAGIGYTGFYIGIGLTVVSTVPDAPNAGFYWWSAMVAIVLRFRFQGTIRG